MALTRGAAQSVKPLDWLILFAPAAIVADLLHAPALVVFVTSAIAIIPLSALLGRATESLAAHVGPAIGGLLNATLGNLAELIIAGIALNAGLIELVKASITGSILGNLLLVLGAAQLVGGLKYKLQRFNVRYAGMSVSLLVIAAVGLLVPTFFHALHVDVERVRTVRMSEFVAGILMLSYGLSLVYSMRTHRDVVSVAPPSHPDIEHAAWPMRRTLLVLGAAAAAIAVMSELLVGATTDTVATLGLSQFFVGIIVVPIIGNAAEHSTAVLVARRNQMDLGVSIAIGSSIQVALLVAPLLVFLGAVLGKPMDLAFSAFEVASVTVAVWIGTTVVLDGESNWLEGALLLLVYAMLSVAFYFF
ncbi:MAG TPA: calcium/proton exchanger [Gemmatimonadaceae bacterium]|nr:calcium/proton exchanger [Gemmatimonadaceae bacterium]